MSDTPLALVPVPRFHSPLPGHVRLGAGTYVQAPEDPQLAPVIRRLCDRLSRHLGCEVTANGLTHATGTDIQLVLDSKATASDDPTTTDDEGYTLTVDDHGIVLQAATVAGLRHATTTLLALVETAPRAHTSEAGPVDLPGLQVADAPRFSWRGLHLDVARHFLDVAAVCEVLDLMADLRLNRLHLHLTDDQGWRIQLASRPLLTEPSGAHDASGGYYTAADLAHIEDAASDLGIVVVPEIDLPGHVNAATHAYGELNPSGEPTEAYAGIDVGFSRLHAELPSTASFIRDVLGETASMTRGPWIHLGGDEALGLSRADYDQLVTTALEVVTHTGKIAIGRQEIAGADLPAGSVVQFWDVRPDANPTAAAVVNAAHRGALVLLSPASRTCLGMRYDSRSPLGLEWAGHLTLRRSYDWEPDDVLEDLPPGAVLGVEACLGTETVHTLAEVTALLLPWLAAVAEVAWSTAQTRDWEDFRARLAPFARRWTATGTAWTRTPDGTWLNDPLEQESSPTAG